MVEFRSIFPRPFLIRILFQICFFSCIWCFNNCLWAIVNSSFADLQCQRDRVNLTIECGMCGASNREEANYCLRCGNRFTLYPQRDVNSIMPTAACQNHMPIPSSFSCAACGAPICSACSQPRAFYGGLCGPCNHGLLPGEFTIPNRWFGYRPNLYRLY